MERRLLLITSWLLSIPKVFKAEFTVEFKF